MNKEQQLNLNIARLVYPSAEEYIFEGGHALAKEKGRDIWDAVNYTDDWNDLMPLIIEHKINLEWLGDIWKADDFYGMIRFDNGNPQIALAECLREVLKEKNNGYEI